MNLMNYFLNKDLDRAAFEGNSDLVKRLIEEGFNIKLKNDNGLTPIHSAAIGGHIETVKIILESNPNAIDMRDSDGNTPLHWAAFKGHKDLAKYLTDSNCDQTLKNNEGRAPIHSAAVNNQLEMVKFFIESNSNAVNMGDSYGNTPLHWAAFEGHKDLAKYLADSNCDQTLKNNEGRAPIHSAAVNNQLEMVKFFIESNPNAIDMSDRDGNTPLHWAAFEGHKDLVNLLIKTGADVYIKNHHSKAAIHVAAEWEDSIIVRAIEKEYPDSSNILNGEEKTPAEILSSTFTTDGYAAINYMCGGAFATLAVSPGLRCVDDYLLNNKEKSCMDHYVNAISFNNIYNAAISTGVSYLMHYFHLNMNYGINIKDSSFYNEYPFVCGALHASASSLLETSINLVGLMFSDDNFAE